VNGPNPGGHDVTAATAPGSTDHEVVPDRRAAKREAKRAQILAAAWELAHRDGIGAISLRELAPMVDLRQPSLYQYFESKDALYDAMFAEGNRALLEQTDIDVSELTPRAAVAEVMQRVVQFATDDPARHQLMAQRPMPGFEPSPESYAFAVAFYERSRAALVAAGVRDQDDMDVFTALVSGLAHQQVANDPGGDRWVRLVPRVLDMFFEDLDRRRRAERRAAKGER
jgi:AcrR family transcriptional regulator